jgi:hypothetical protein
MAPHSSRCFTALGSVVLGFSALACSAAGSADPEIERNRSGESGISTDLLGINVAADSPGGAAIGALGASWVRIELRDGTVGEQLSQEAIARVSGSLDDYHAHGIKVLLVLDYTTRAGFGGGGAHFCPPQGDWQGWRAEFLARAAHAAQTFGDRVDAWQVWNEPDHPCGAAPGYDPYVPPHEFGLLQRDTYAQIRTGSSSPVILGGLESGDASYLDKMRAAAGVSHRDYADGVGIQIYGVVPNDSWCVPGGPAENEYLNCAWGRHDGKVHEYFERSGGLPVWVTEVGFRTEDTLKQANYLEDAYHAFASTGDRLARVFWFAYSDAMVPPFGLTDTGFAPKSDVYARYQELAGVSGGGTPPPGGGAEPLTCGDLASKNGWADSYCEWNGNGACNGQGPATSDCAHCCRPTQAPPPDPSCGDLASREGWTNALCEWNGNGACGGQGTPTYDCDFCCNGG